MFQEKQITDMPNLSGNLSTNINGDPIDADQEKYIQAVNEALAATRDQSARWWHYTTSHSTFELVVGDARGNNVVVCLIACSSIQGPVRWDNQNLRMIWSNRHAIMNYEFTLVDEIVGFKAEAGTFRWRSNFDLWRYGSIHTPEDRLAIIRSE